MKISELQLLSNPAAGDYVPADTGSGPATGRYTLSTLLTKFFGPMLWPVGSIYTSTSSANPNTTLGFGTWAAFAAGRFVVGVGTSDQSFAGGATGGESNHTLTTAEMPSHGHYNAIGVNGAIIDWNGGSTYGYQAGSGTFGSTSAHSPSAYFANAGGSGAHNNLPPYVAAYMWQRTA